MQLEKYRRREENRVSESTLRGRMSALNNLKGFIDDDREVEVEDVEEWVDMMIEMKNAGEMKASTIKQYYKAATYYFDKVKGEPEALDHIKRWLPDTDVDPGEFLLEEEWNQLRNSVHNMRDRAIIELMYFYARRPSEIRLLNMADLDMEEGTITFNILKKKKDDRGKDLPVMKLMKDGEVYESHPVMRATFQLKPDPGDALSNYLTYRPDVTETVKVDGEEAEVEPVFATSHGRISYDTVRRIVKDAADRAGIDKNITPKSKRHSRATHLDWAGHTPGEIARQQLLHDPDTGTSVIAAYVHERGEEQVREPLDIDDDGNKEETDEE